MWNKKTVIGLLLIIPLFVVLAWWGVYEYGFKKLEKAIELEIKKLNKKGFNITYTHMNFSGSAFLISAKWKDLQIENLTGTYQFTFPEFELTARPWEPTVISFNAEQGVNIVATFLNQYKWSELDTERFSGTINLNYTLDLNDIQFYVKHIQPKILGKDTTFYVNLLEGQVYNAGDPWNAHGNFSMGIKGVGQSLGMKGFDYPLKLQFEYALSGIEPNQFFPNLKQWSNAGGILDIKSADLDWELLKVKGNGSLTLDSKLRPLGSLSLTFQEFDDALSAFVKAGHMKKSEAQALSFAIHLVEGKPAYGKKDIYIPITLQKGYLRVGAMKLMKLDSIEPAEGLINSEELAN